MALLSGWRVGLSDTAAKKPMTPNDLLLQGSVGKTYVSAVALQLVHEGKIGLDDKVEKYLGKEAWFARLPNGPDITVRMIMTHTSGLVRYEFKEQFTTDLTKNPDKVWKPEELIAYILDSPPPFAVGKGWQYSDTNYIVLGMIIERVTKSTYYQNSRNASWSRSACVTLSPLTAAPFPASRKATLARIILLAALMR